MVSEMSKKKGLFALLVMLALSVLLLSSCKQDETPTIGVIVEVSILEPSFDGFKAGMTELGYVEGEDVTYIYNGITEATPEAMDAEIKNLLDQQVDMLVTVGTLAHLQAKQAVAGTDMPVVFLSCARPVDTGLIDSINQPGGNLTGTQVGLSFGKALEMLVEVSQAQKVYVPYNPNDEASLTTLPFVEERATSLGIELVLDEVGSVAEAVTAIETLPEDIDAIFRIPSPTLDPENNLLSQAAIEQGLPMGGSVPLDDAVLISVTNDLFESGKAAAPIADHILNGVDPAVEPVRSTDFTLTVNLETANAIGLEISDAVLGQADTIIRP